MDETMLNGFFDELEKIGANASYQSSSQSVMTSPAPSFTPPKPIGTGSLQPKGTNYSMVHSEEPVAAYGSAAGAKMVPPPPVRT